MILIMNENASLVTINNLITKLNWMNLQCVTNEENGRYHLAIVNGGDDKTDFSLFKNLEGVEEVVPFKQKYKLASRQCKSKKTVISIKDVKIGGSELAIMAGPCSIESNEQIDTIASFVAANGANILRGGAFKPRTSPYDFQGLGETGLKYMQAAAEKYGLLSISEVMDTRDVGLVAEYVDILQIGARNMQNFSLLKKAGESQKPVMLKRGLSATYVDLLMAAEYILQTGNPNVILCERGIRTFETYARNTLDIAAVPILHDLSHLPVIIDPSHGTGIRRMVPPMAYAAVAAEADGIMVEVHTHPDKAISDANQTISTETFAEMMKKVRQLQTICKN